MTRPLVVSYFTSDYAEHARGLAASLVENGVTDYAVLEVKDAEPNKSPGQRWQANTVRKAEFMRRMLGVNVERGVLWLDADARVRSDQLAVTLDGWSLDDGVHIAAHWRDSLELLSGTLFMRGPLALQVATLWAGVAKQMTQMWDQRLLAMVLHAVPGLRIEVLPASHCWIAEFMSEQCPRDQVVVEHLQHSRVIRSMEPVE